MSKPMMVAAQYLGTEKDTLLPTPVLCAFGNVNESKSVSLLLVNFYGF